MQMGPGADLTGGRELAPMQNEGRKVGVDLWTDNKIHGSFY